MNRVRVLAIAAGVLAALGAVGGLIAYNAFFREEPPPFFESEEDHFLFGSIGTESTEGVPYWIWLVLPRIFPEYLPGPGGYAALGVLAKDGHEMPVGLSKVTIGFPRVGINCAMCHAARVRTIPDEVPRVIAAAASHQTAPQLYLQFLMNCAADSRFTADTILAEIDRNHRLSMMERLLYRLVIIPQTRQALLRQKEMSAWMNHRPAWGRGRIDPFNPVKFRYLGQAMDETIGNSDMMPLWGMAKYPKRAFHWDGLNTKLEEVVLSSAIGDGATLAWVDRDYARWNDTNIRTMSSLRRIQNYIGTLAPPPYPFPIDKALAQAGEIVYRSECAGCHAPDGARMGQVIPQTEVGTDRHRLEMWTKSAAAAYNAHGGGHAWAFTNFRSTEGYVAVPHDGLWLKAPYLHNGSVPSLVDLLEPPASRPTGFWRGYDLFDPGKVGFVSDGPARQDGSYFDTAQPGNSNAGHVYGTTLSPESKRALLEYLKTL